MSRLPDNPAFDVMRKDIDCLDQVFCHPVQHAERATQMKQATILLCLALAASRMTESEHEHPTMLPNGATWLRHHMQQSAL
jgi:hypothetical protein